MDNFNGKSPGFWTESKSKGLGDSSIKNKGFTTIDIPGCLPQLCSLAPCSLGSTAFGSLLVEASSVEVGYPFGSHPRINDWEHPRARVQLTVPSFTPSENAFFPSNTYYGTASFI